LENGSLSVIEEGDIKIVTKLYSGD